jgi:hypothetical protein
MQQVQFKTELILHAISNSTHHIIQAKLIVASNGPYLLADKSRIIATFLAQFDISRSI